MKRFKKVKELFKWTIRDKSGMELVQCAILVAIAVALGILFREQVMAFVNNTFSSLSDAGF